MSSAAAIGFQIGNAVNLERIERFMNASAYQQNLEYSSNYNAQLSVERRLRLPFYDQQTGVAQNPCSLFMTRRQRMPGFKAGQIYSYPAARWRKRGREYLAKMMRPYNGLPAATPKTIAIIPKCPEVVANDTIESELNGGNASLFEESTSLGATTGDTSDSKDSQTLKEELPKEWFYDEMDMTEVDTLDDPKSPADDEYDYDPRYGAKKRRRRGKSAGATGKSKSTHSGDSPRKGRPSGGGTSANTKSRGRRKARSKSGRKIDPPSPSMVEPPSFESAAAAVKYGNDDSCSGDIRSYRKYY